MHRFNRPHIRVRQEGQTLIIALIVLGVLLILGLVFLGLVDRNIRNASRSQRRSASADLAEAGIRYAHSQLVTSLLGADWRGLPTPLKDAATGVNTTADPDAYYLRPSSGLTVKDPSDSTGTRTVTDLGGPDMRGPFIRVPFPQGRSLVRIRYGASDALPQLVAPGGPLRNPGAARATLIIEAVGRTGVINPFDPTTFNAANPIQFQGFADETTLRAGIGALAQADSQLVTSRRMVAFAPIGIIDAARFETNVFNSSAPIQIGIPSGLGAKAYNDIDPTKPNDPSTDVGSNLEAVLGTPGATATTNPSLTLPRGFGSFIANGDVEIYGNLHVFTNRTLGDTFRVAGRISDGDAANPAKLTITPSTFNPMTGQYATASSSTVLTESGTSSFDSQSPNFSTAGGLVLDGSARTDQSGYSSGVGLLVPPSTQTVDPQTKLNRYVAMTRESGVALNGQENSGAFGHGSGVYVDNTADRQESTDAQGRKAIGSAKSLFDDWLNPNSGQADSGWKGPFYQPMGAVVQLLPDGFIIQRDATVATERTWKDYAGNDSGTSTIRYRLGRVGNQVYVVDSLTPGVTDINGTGINFANGVPFNGVLYFEGNVRVRGTIPTDVQMTLVSGATIYIEGSITKGITANEVTSGGTNPRFPSLAKGDAISALPLASLMLMAKDNVAVNTTMFFGPTAGQFLAPANDTTGATNISPVVINPAATDGSTHLELNLDLALDTTTSQVPSNWQPYAMTYKSWDNNPGLTGNLVPTELLLAQTMEDSNGAASFLQLDANFGSGGTGASAYPFVTDYSAASPDDRGLWDNVIVNTAATYLLTNSSPAPANYTPGLYGLGGESWQRYAKFETRSFPLVPTPSNAAYSGTGPTAGKLTQSTAGFTAYSLFSGGNDLLIRPGAISGVPSNNLLVGRVAVTPSEAKIEASIFAEQGSFFVIPGPWFNPNPNDTHDAYAASVASSSGSKARADRERLEAYGTAPGSPFYGEPLDVRLGIVGSVAENLPPPIAVQSEWIRKWGWIPRRQGATGVGIPIAHVPSDPNFDITKANFVPNLTIQYDPVLATGRLNDPLHPDLVRMDDYGRPLPPMPRLPVSPKLAYFGEL